MQTSELPCKRFSRLRSTNRTISHESSNQKPVPRFAAPNMLKSTEGSSHLWIILCQPPGSSPFIHEKDAPVALLSHRLRAAHRHRPAHKPHPSTERRRQAALPFASGDLALHQEAHQGGPLLGAGARRAVRGDWSPGGWQRVGVERLEKKGGLKNVKNRS